MAPHATKAFSESERALCVEAADACACFNFRKASRIVTQFYDEQLAPSGLRSTQVVILLAIATLGNPGIVELSEALVLDRTTLTRNLKPLEEQGLVVLKAGEDRRRREVTLAGPGRAALRRAIPLWERAQGAFVAQLGATRWRELHRSLQETVLRTRDVVSNKTNGA